MAIKEYGVWICNVCKKEFQAFTSSPNLMMNDLWVEQGNNFICFECKEKNKELDEFLKRMEKKSKPMVGWSAYSGSCDPHLFDYKWTCPHCGSKASISPWFEFGTNKIVTVQLKYTCYNCGRQRYEKIPDIIEENGEAYIEEQ